MKTLATCMIETNYLYAFLDLIWYYTEARLEGFIYTLNFKTGLSHIEEDSTMPHACYFPAQFIILDYLFSPRSHNTSPW